MLSHLMCGRRRGKVISFGSAFWTNVIHRDDNFLVPFDLLAIFGNVLSGCIITVAYCGWLKKDCCVKRFMLPRRRRNRDESVVYK